MYYEWDILMWDIIAIIYMHTCIYSQCQRVNTIVVHKDKLKIVN